MAYAGDEFVLGVEVEDQVLRRFGVDEIEHCWEFL